MTLVIKQQLLIIIIKGWHDARKMFRLLQGDHKKKEIKCNLQASWRKVMKTKGVSYDLENDLMFLKCLGSYRVTTKKVFYRP